MTSIIDEEFGEIKVRKISTRYIRLKINEHGEVSATMPKYASLRSLKSFLDKSRESLRESLRKMPKITKKLTENEKKALKKSADHWLKHRLFALAKQHELKYERVRIMNAKTRWGSCSSSGTISLNIALMKLPENLRDYVILHELTHTIEMNHSPKFWAKLGSYCPNPKKTSKEMKKYSPYL